MSIIILTFRNNHFIVIYSVLIQQVCRSTSLSIFFIKGDQSKLLKCKVIICFNALAVMKVVSSWWKTSAFLVYSKHDLHDPFTQLENRKWFSEITLRVMHSTPSKECDKWLTVYCKLYRGVFSTIWIAFLNCDWFWSTDKCHQWINILLPNCR